MILNGFGDITAKNNPLLQSASRNRDYEKEAVEFFVMKLTKFGPELQVCILRISFFMFHPYSKDSAGFACQVLVKLSP